MNLLLGSLTIGFFLSLLALGVYLSFRVYHFADITADGSFPLGAAVAGVMIAAGIHPGLATLAGFGAGLAAGLVTGTIHTRFRVHPLLSGILVMTALYSINLHIMGRSNVPIMGSFTLVNSAEQALARASGRQEYFFMGWEIGMRDLAALGLALALVAACAACLYLFLRTSLGTAMRATGNNAAMVRALGINSSAMITLGLTVSNGLIALSGALMAQYQGFADVQMGIGMIVWGLASVIIGEALVGSNRLGLALAGAIMGSILFRLLVAIALRWGLHPNNLKLITAVFVFAALVLPLAAAKLRKECAARRAPGAGAAG